MFVIIFYFFTFTDGINSWVLLPVDERHQLEMCVSTLN